MSDLTRRIETMHRRDIAVAMAFILGLWFAIIFVALVTWPLAPSGAARIMRACSPGAALSHTASRPAP